MSELPQQPAQQALPEMLPALPALQGPVPQVRPALVPVLQVRVPVQRVPLPALQEPALPVLAQRLLHTRQVGVRTPQWQPV